MERFVIGAAIVVAVLIAGGTYFANNHEDSDFVMQVGGYDVGGGGSGAAKGTGQPSAVMPKTYAGAVLKVRDAVAVLKVIPEDRADISVEIANPGKLGTPVVRMDGDAVVVDGGLRRRIQDCGGGRGAFEVSVRGVGDVREAEMPVITVRTPRNVDVSVGGAVKSDIGAAAAADLSFSGCGDATVADVAGALDLSSAGSGDVTVGNAASATISAAGSGDATLAAVAGKLEVSVAGSGSVMAESVAGPLDVSIAGSGDVTVAGGAVTDADISIAGSGDVSVTGNVAKLDVSIMGSGDVTVRGAAASVDANIMGSGDVQVASVTGGVQKAVMGSGSVTVGPISEEN